MSKKNNRKNKALKVLQKRKAYAEGGQQQLYARRKDSSGIYEDDDDFQARVQSAQTADPNYNRDAYQNALRSGQGVAAVAGPADADYSFKPASVTVADSAPETQPDPKPETQPDPKLETQPDPKPETQPDPKPETTTTSEPTLASTPPPNPGLLLTGTRFDGKEYTDDAKKIFQKDGVDQDNDMVISKEEWLSWMASKEPTKGSEEQYKERILGAIKSGSITDATRKAAYKSIGIDPEADAAAEIERKKQEGIKKEADKEAARNAEIERVAEEERKKRQAWYDGDTGYSGPPTTDAQKEYYAHLKSLEGLSNKEIAVIIDARNERIANQALQLAEDQKENLNLGEEGYNTGPIDVENKRPEDPDVERAAAESAIDVPGSTLGNAEAILANPDSSPKAKAMARSVLDNAAISRNVQSLDTDGTGVTGPDISGGTTSVTAGTATTVTDPADINEGSYEGVAAGDLTDTDAASSAVSRLAEADGPSLTERAAAATRDPEQEQAARQADPRDLKPSPDSLTGEVGFREEVGISLTEEAEVKSREGIVGPAAKDAAAAQIIKTIGFNAAERRTVTGTAAKAGASKMLEVVGELPPTITANIVEDPAEVTAQIDSQPVEVRAAIAALPTEALVSSQMESLLAGIDEGQVPTWARPAVAQVNDMMARRGLTTSTVGRDALFNAIIQTAMPMAQSNAQALQATAAQNLSNQQQANLAEATQSMQLRMANLSNRQTSESQSAQMAQQMKAMQSQFGQDAVMTTAQIQQQTRTQNLSNRQQAAQVDAQNIQAMAAQSLGNEQQIELANLQYANATESENMSAVQQERMTEMQVAADYIAKNAGFRQQMELANLNNEQQVTLANLSARNQADSESLSAAQQTELANLNTRMQTNLTQGKIAESMGVAQLNVDQQRAVTNASVNANMDLTKFNAEQQVAVANSKFMQTMALTDFNAEQQAAMQNATSLATMDMATADQNTKLAITNAQNFLNMDMANLSNKQQGVILDQQMDQQRLLSAQSATNASKQFNATSENQINQFNTSLAATISQFNKTQSNTMEQFNKSEKNKLAAIDSGNALQAATAEAQIEADVSKFNNQQDLQRETWNAANAQAVEQSNVQWRRQANTAGTAAANAANQQNVQNAYNMSALELTQLWQQIRDEATYIRQAYESNEGREAQLLATAIGNEGAMYKGRTGGVSTLVNIVKDFTGNDETPESARGTGDTSFTTAQIMALANT